MSCDVIKYGGAAPRRRIGAMPVSHSLKLTRVLYVVDVRICAKLLQRGRV
jgi:hypothetical protein